MHIMVSHLYTTLILYKYMYNIMINVNASENYKVSAIKDNYKCSIIIICYIYIYNVDNYYVVWVYTCVL